MVVLQLNPYSLGNVSSANANVMLWHVTITSAAHRLAVGYVKSVNIVFSYAI